MNGARRHAFRVPVPVAVLTTGLSFALGLTLVLKPDRDGAQFAKRRVISTRKKKCQAMEVLHGCFTRQYLALFACWMRRLMIKVFKHHKLRAAKPFSRSSRGVLAFEVPMRKRVSVE